MRRMNNKTTEAVPRGSVGERRFSDRGVGSSTLGWGDGHSPAVGFAHFIMTGKRPRMRAINTYKAR